VSLYEWLLLLHLFAAFALVAGVTAYGVIVFSGADAAQRALAPTAAALWNVGGLGVIVFGVWLALEVEGYELWDGWIVTAIVLWLIAFAAGGPLARSVGDGSAPSEGGRARLLATVMILATVALLLDMIFKPGA
jgi:uncharacterized membrane protein